jgi:hypothetical protein
MASLARISHPDRFVSVIVQHRGGGLWPLQPVAKQQQVGLSHVESASRRLCG